MVLCRLEVTKPKLSRTRSIKYYAVAQNSLKNTRVYTISNATPKNIEVSWILIIQLFVLTTLASHRSYGGGGSGGIGIWQKVHTASWSNRERPRTIIWIVYL